MNLPPNIVAIWLMRTVISGVIVFALAYWLRSQPRLYLCLWCSAVFVFGLATLWAVYRYASVPLFSDRRGHSDPGAMFPMPGELLGAVFDDMLRLISIPNLLGLAFSPPCYRPSRRAWWAGVVVGITAIASAVTLLAIDRRQADDFKRASASAKAGWAEVSKWNKVRPPDPAVGPRTRGEWNYLGAVPKYSGEPDGDLVELYFTSERGQFRPEALKWLKNQTSLEFLHFDGLLSDDDVVHLKPLTWLKRLELQKAAITDKGLAELTPLKSLEYLDLTGTPVTAASLEAFKQFPSLREVYLVFTKISHDEQREFYLHNYPPWNMTMRGLERRTPESQPQRPAATQ